MDRYFDLTSSDARAARALVQWSQAQLAQAAELSISTIADFEKGTRTPIANNLAAMRRAFEGAGVCFTPEGPTVFSELSLHIMTQKGITEMLFRYALAGAAAVQEIVAAFGTAEGDVVELNAVQAATSELKLKIGDLLARHGAAAPSLNKLRKIVGTLAEGEFFLVLPQHPATTAERYGLERYLHQINHPDDQVDDQGITDLFGPLLDLYDVTNPRTDRHTVVGAGQGMKRCRFCSRTPVEGATFKKAAHIIPTALGNDHLKSAEECDDCNEYFGREIEPSLIAMLDIQGVFWGPRVGAKTTAGRRFGLARVFSPTTAPR